MEALSPILDAFRGQQRKPTLILLISAPLLLAWKYACAPEVLAGFFVGLPDDEALSAGAILHFLSALLFLGLLPAAIVKWVFRERLRDYGFGFGTPGRTIGTFVIFAPLFFLGGMFASTDAAILEKFPINPLAGNSPSSFALHATAYFAYYLGWEFYFRGFLLFGLRDTLGDANAVLIQVMASSLLHIGSPASETFGAIPGGILWGILTLRNRSFLSALGQHYVLGISLDWFICHG
jgi:membrane protease YdiL (CAAX protease family)